MSGEGRTRGLGRGLSALLGEPTRDEQPSGALAQLEAASASVVTSFPAAIAPADDPFASVTAFAADFSAAVSGHSAGGTTMELPLEALSPNNAQPRRSFDEVELEELAKSIRRHGVLQPILVSPAGEGRFEIIAGERRWRAAKRAGLSVIPALVREAGEDARLEIAIIENVQRADLNPIEEAQGYQALMDRFGRTQAEVAEVVGKSRSHVANTLRLLQLSGEIQDMVRDGRLSAGHARAVLTAPNPVLLAQRAIAGALSVRELERLAQEAKEPAAAVAVAARPEKDEDLAALEASLARALQALVTITPKGEGGGVLRVTYTDAAQLNELCRRLSAA